MKIVKNILILVSVLVIAYFCGFIFGEMYMTFIPHVNEGFFSFPTSAAAYIIGWPLAYIFSLTLFFTALGDAKKYWWIGIGLIPAALFEIAFDSRHLYFPILLGLVGWLLGSAVALLVEKKK